MTCQNLTFIYLFVVLRKLEILEIPKSETILTAPHRWKIILEIKWKNPRNQDRKVKHSNKNHRMRSHSVFVFVDLVTVWSIGLAVQRFSFFTSLDCWLMTVCYNKISKKPFISQVAPIWSLILCFDFSMIIDN